MDAGGLKRYIAQERRRIEGQREVLGDGASGSSKTAEHRLFELSLTLELLNDDPAERKTAAQIVAAFEGDIPPTPEDLAVLLENVRILRIFFFRIECCVQFFEGRCQVSGNESDLVKWIVCTAAVRHLDIAVSAERLVEKVDSTGTGGGRGTKKTKTFYDDYLPEHAVHVLPVDESFGIRVLIAQDQQLRFPLGELAAVEVIPPDGKAQSVTLLQQCKEGHALDALAFVDPTTFDSERLNKKCPIFGLVDTKYVRLTLHLILKLGNDFPYDIDVYVPLYLQLKRATRGCGLFAGMRYGGEAVMRLFGWKKSSKTSAVQHIP